MSITTPAGLTIMPNLSSSTYPGAGGPPPMGAAPHPGGPRQPLPPHLAAGMDPRLRAPLPPNLMLPPTSVPQQSAPRPQVTPQQQPGTSSGGAQGGTRDSVITVKELMINVIEKSLANNAPPTTAAPGGPMPPSTASIPVTTR